MGNLRITEGGFYFKRKSGGPSQWESYLKQLRREYIRWEREKASALAKISSIRASLIKYGEKAPTSMRFTKAQLRGMPMRKGRKKFSVGSGRTRQLYAKKMSKKLRLQKQRALGLAKGTRSQLSVEAKRISKLSNPYAREVGKYYTVRRNR